MKVSKDTQALIFDCDGTLADTMPIHFRGWQETLAKRGHDFSEELFYQMAGIPTEKIVHQLNEKYGTDYIAEEILREKEGLFLKRISEVEPIHHVIEMVHEYKDKLPLAVASGGLKELVLKTLDAVGLNHDLFGSIVAAEDVQNHKPAPDTFLLAAKQLNIEPQYCQVYEDGDLGIEAALRANMKVVDIRKWY